MHHTLLFVIILLFVVVLLVILAQQIKIAYPIFLVITGLGISFIPGMPILHLDPDLIFSIFLPPLLYEAAWFTSWNDFWKWKYTIGLLAFGLVLFTSSIVAYSSTLLIPGFTLGLGFLLGAVVSPPDAIAATTVLKEIIVPKQLMTILKGESLVNDAASLIIFRFSIVAVLTAQFSVGVAIGQFFWVAGMGVLIGVVGGHVMYGVHRFLPTTPSIDAALTILTPYLLFLIAQEFHFSGIIAVVTGGLFMSFRAHEVFKTGSTRLNMLGVWTTLVFVMNALVFILIGLELPEIIQGLGAYSISVAIKYGLLIALITILLRFLWVFPVVHFPNWISAKVKREPSPEWKGPLIVSWAGMRGVVSLSTALSIPLFLVDGSIFPQRNLIIFIAFIVIFVTLVFQGLTLPYLISVLHVKEADQTLFEEEQRANIELKLDEKALELLNKEYQDALKQNKMLQLLKAELEAKIVRNNQHLGDIECTSTQRKEIDVFQSIQLKIYKQQRKELSLMRRENLYSEELIQKAELQLDLNELKITGTGR